MNMVRTFVDDPSIEEEFVRASKVCGYCEGTGVAFYPNGEDDYTKEYCICKAGRELESKEA